MARTSRWARRCLATNAAPGQLRFGIGQGVHLDLRRAHLAELTELPFDGFALGGLGVGEAPEVMHGVIAEVAAEMPADRPRYLMGVGTPEDIWQAIGAGIDMFDCVMPTRNARNGQLFTKAGRLNIGNARHRDEPQPIEEGVRLRLLRALQPRLSGASLSRQRAALLSPGDDSQPRALLEPRAARPRRHRGGRLVSGLAVVDGGHGEAGRRDPFGLRVG